MIEQVKKLNLPAPVGRSLDETVEQQWAFGTNKFYAPTDLPVRVAERALTETDDFIDLVGPMPIKGNAAQLAEEYTKKEFRPPIDR
jgi:hypothetical protein